MVIENVRWLRAAGVRLVAGTDAPNPGTGAGISMHSFRSGASAALVVRNRLAPQVAALDQVDSGRPRCLQESRVWQSAMPSVRRFLPNDRRVQGEGRWN